MADWILGIVQQAGYLGIALLMLLENVLPPIPSEIIMPFAGFAASQGELHPVGVVLAGTCGSLAGAALWFALGRRVGGERMRRWVERHGRWLTLSVEEADRAQAWFRRRGRMAVFLGRLVPALRTLVSVPAGVTGMPWPAFLLWSALGSALWNALLMGIGYALGNRYQEVTDVIDWITRGVLALLVLLYLWRVARPAKKPKSL